MSKATLIHGSAHDLSALAPGSVHMIATSPPYWGLRKYAGDQDVEWQTVTYTPMAGLPPVTVQGCEAGCAHEWASAGQPTQRQRNGAGGGIHDGRATNKLADNVVLNPGMVAYCVHCGGWRGPLGLEPDPLAYVGHLVLVFRELWRVLRDDGVCFLNLGDSYNGSGGAGGDYAANGIKAGQPKYPGRNMPGLKPKDLCGIPERAVLALQADGWYWRSPIVWAKGVSFLPDYAGSVMPESVTDRPTKAHEMVYLLSKRARYYFDSEAVKEESVSQDHNRFGNKNAEARLVDRLTGNMAPGKHAEPTRTGRNLRDVWVINPAGYAGAHFATWPEALVRPMILAGSSARGVCPACGAPWVRVVERSFVPQPDVTLQAGVRGANGQKPLDDSDRRQGYPRGTTDASTLGWLPSCACDAGEPIPATVLDPFSGSGTTGKVALALGCDYIGVDIAGEYHDTLAAERLSNLQMEMAL